MFTGGRHAWQACLTTTAIVLLLSVRTMAVVRAEANSDERITPAPAPVPSPDENLPFTTAASADEGPGADWFRITHGAASGDVTDSSAVIWARCSYPAIMHVRLALNPDFKIPMPGEVVGIAVEAEDFTASARLKGLRPATVHYDEVWLTGGAGRLGRGAEGTPTGFERELTDLLGTWDSSGVKNLIFLTSGSCTAAEFAYQIDLGGDGKPLVFHELVSGPLSAKAGEPASLDQTLQPKQLYAEGGIFNFGAVRIASGTDGRGHLSAEIRGEDGKVRPGSGLDLIAQ